jgi:hypothetical protein
VVGHTALYHSVSQKTLLGLKSLCGSFLIIPLVPTPITSSPSTQTLVAWLRVLLATTCSIAFVLVHLFPPILPTKVPERKMGISRRKRVLRTLAAKARIKSKEAAVQNTVARALTHQGPYEGTLDGSFWKPTAKQMQKIAASKRKTSQPHRFVFDRPLRSDKRQRQATRSTTTDAAAKGVRVCDSRTEGLDH